jgi:hypothetical protein
MEMLKIDTYWQALFYNDQASTTRTKIKLVYLICSALQLQRIYASRSDFADMDDFICYTPYSETCFHSVERSQSGKSSRNTMATDLAHTC